MGINRGKRAEQISSTWAAGSVLAGMLIMLTGCSTWGGSVLPQSLEQRLAQNPTVEDYLAAAELYQEKAQALREDAARLEKELVALEAKPSDDKKGLRRDSLRRLSGTYRLQARELEQLHADYHAKAETLVTNQRQQEIPVPAGS